MPVRLGRRLLHRAVNQLFLCAAIAATQAAVAAQEFLADPSVAHAIEAQLTVEAGGAWEIGFLPAEFPRVEWKPASEAWDWSAAGGMEWVVENAAAGPVRGTIRVDNPSVDGKLASNTFRFEAQPGKNTLRFRLPSATFSPLWGMRGLPERPEAAQGPALDPARIAGFQLYLHRLAEPRTLKLHRVALLPAATETPLPFVDAFGQYAHATWPGKLAADADLLGRRDLEEAALLDSARPKDFDRYGGWAAGPQREATGWFRTEKAEGKWWLVTPEGRLFFSLGMNCVGTWERTFVEQRKPWFEWLPQQDDPLFGALYHHLSGAHSMAETIGGTGRVFSFYAANLARKHGPNWQERWRPTTYRRLNHWGFNTIANWAQRDVLENSPLPYVASCALSGVPPIGAAQGYWSPMMDVYSPEFPGAVESAIATLTRPHRDRPLCIGYFVDNELAWEGVVRGVLRSPASQPARAALIVLLQDLYPTVDALNAAWQTDFKEWAAIATPAQESAAFGADTDRFLERFANRYFSTVADALHRHAPNQLYLGVRFASEPAPVVRACAAHADVLSFNRYQRTFKGDEFSSLGKPVILSEFHFGATDRGMFHPGISGVADQAARAEAYTKYVRSALACPEVVGTHWFQYVDEPITGRWFDGENFNIGFVDVTDTPYPELVKAAELINASAYETRAKP